MEQDLEKYTQGIQDDYNLETINVYKRNLNPIKIDQNITEKTENIRSLFREDGTNNRGKPYMFFTGYKWHKIRLLKKDFDRQTKGHYLHEGEIRHKLFPHVKEVLNNPDEIWVNLRAYNSIKSVQYRYIKCYQNAVLIVDVRITPKDGLYINTWYKKRVADDKLRKGMLLMSKIRKQ